MGQNQASQLYQALVATLKDHMVPNAADMSDPVNSVKDSSKEKPEEEAQFRKQDLAHLNMSKKNVLFVVSHRAKFPAT